MPLREVGVLSREQQIEAMLYEHRGDMVCYDHPEDYCCTCGEHRVAGYRRHLTGLVARMVTEAERRALRDAADVMDMFEPFPGEESDWLRDRADRIGGDS